jgi:1,4-alpha-glucan branching enzyme
MTDYPFDFSALEAISQGRCGNAFAHLGLHNQGGAWWVVAFDPGAEALAVHQGGAQYQADALGLGGIFAAQVAGDAPYTLHWRGFGAQWVQEDPYRFGPVLGDLDRHLLIEGRHQRIWQVLGAHIMVHQGVAGTHFAVWAPNARRVSVVGDFNHWDGRRAPMRAHPDCGIWEIFLPNVGQGAVYRYEILGVDGQVLPLKSDPVGFGSEHAPANASVVRDISGAHWTDDDWMAARGAAQTIDAPISIYEVHLPSWRRAQGGRMLSYTELAQQLVDYAAWMGFTHIEFMPISEYPFDGSWGYQPVGLFAPTIRHGLPHELRALIDAAHNRGLGVLIDWVPGHFPTDSHGLAQFDGTALFEHLDPKEGFHQDWNTLIYNYGRAEVANFLVSNARYWLEEYHIDGLRVDAVASMLYRDYSRSEGQWVPNHHGGRENYEAIALLQDMNTQAYSVDGIMTVAEESTAFDGVSRPVHLGGLGFGFKWNMGWMNDTLRYMAEDPINRKYHHHLMTFGLAYAFSENYVLPISHDEVVHGKGSMLQKMGAQGFAGLRAYYGFMWGHPGKKLLFMGCEFAQSREWNHSQSLDWHEADQPAHRGVQLLVRDLNHLYRGEPALHAMDCKPEGFDWIEGGDAAQSVFVWLRRAANAPRLMVVCNMTPVARRYRIGLPAGGTWAEVLNTDSALYGGCNAGNLGGISAEAIPHHGREFSAEITLPPMATLFFKEQMDVTSTGRTI